jgi:ureidoacrylate peracid hydrolase
MAAPGWARRRWRRCRTKVAPVIEALRAKGGTYVSAQFTLVPGPGGAPLIAPHLKELRPVPDHRRLSPRQLGPRPGR